MECRVKKMKYKYINNTILIYTLMQSFNVLNKVTGELVIQINISFTSFNYNQIKELFNTHIITDKDYLIHNDDTLIYTTEYDLNYEDNIIITNLTICFFKKGPIFLIKNQKIIINFFDYRGMYAEINISINNDYVALPNNINKLNYCELKKIFEDALPDDKYYLIYNDDKKIYTNLFDFDENNFDKPILLTNVRILFLKYDKNVIDAYNDFTDGDYINLKYDDILQNI
jgi:hypothetical protein